MWVDPNLAAFVTGAGLLFLIVAAVAIRQAILSGEAFRNEITEHGFTRRRLEDVEAITGNKPWAPTHLHADGGLYALEERVDGKLTGHSVWLPGVLYSNEDGMLFWTDDARWDDRFTPLESGFEPTVIIGRDVGHYITGGGGVVCHTVLHAELDPVPPIIREHLGEPPFRARGVADHWNEAPAYDRAGREPPFNRAGWPPVER